MKQSLDMVKVSRLELQIEVHRMLSNIFLKQCNLNKLESQQLAYRDTTNIEREELEVMYWNLIEENIDCKFNDPTYITFISRKVQ